MMTRRRDVMNKYSEKHHHQDYQNTFSYIERLKTCRSFYRLKADTSYSVYHGVRKLFRHSSHVGLHSVTNTVTTHNPYRFKSIPLTLIKCGCHGKIPRCARKESQKSTNVDDRTCNNVIKFYFRNLLHSVRLPIGVVYAEDELSTMDTSVARDPPVTMDTTVTKGTSATMDALIARDKSRDLREPGIGFGDVSDKEIEEYLKTETGKDRLKRMFTFE